MPVAAPTACSEPGCPGQAVDRGRCAAHRRTTSQRHYGPDWQAVSRAKRARVRACEDCGATDDLTVDELTPRSLGGTWDDANLRVRCRSCHARLGVKITSRSVRT